MNHRVREALLAIRYALIPRGSRREAGYRVVRRAWRVLRACLGRRPGDPTFAAAQVPDLNRQYRIWLSRHASSLERLRQLRERALALPYRPRISIVTPVYNVEDRWLRRTVESVRRQVYENWELCLVDDASSDSHVWPILDAAARQDPRIKALRLEQNAGIAGASNAGLRLATGEFVGFLDHDDELYPEALFEVAQVLAEAPETDVVYSDEDKIAPDGRRIDPFFKPDWSPDLLSAMNYTCHFSVYRRSLVQALGGLRAGLDGSQDWDLILRASERTSRIAHVPRILYGWRQVAGSAAASVTAKRHAYEAGVSALREALARRRLDGSVEMIAPGRYRVRYALRGSPKVSVIVPVRDRVELTRQCIATIESKTAYRNFEIVIVDNGSIEETTLAYFRTLAARHRVVRDDRPFNYSAVNNLGVRHATGEYLLFLNNDTEAVGSEWMEEMLGHAQRDEVGAVGARLLYPDRRIQHAGVFLMGTVQAVAGHAFRHLPESTGAYFHFAHVTRNVSAVTGACMMVRRRVFEEVGGFDERIRVAFNDVDLCLRIRERGYLIVYAPGATLIHHESASRKALHPAEDEHLVRERWADVLERGDQYYNPNLTRWREDYGLDV
jgi:O-antigen biosynthesis protein